MRILNPHWPDVLVNTDPFTWLETAPGVLFDLTAARALSASFPRQGLVRRDKSSRAQTKTYRNYSLPLDTDVVRTSLPAIWQKLVADILSDGYRKEMARILRQPPASELEIRLVQHSTGDWLGPHTDSLGKLFSHILYFNDIWCAEDGGCFEILRSAASYSVCARVVPVLGASAILCPSDQSWHQVSRVSLRAPSWRRSLLVHGTLGQDDCDTPTPH